VTQPIKALQGGAPLGLLAFVTVFHGGRG
jgi:hypothetical protein